MITARHIKPSPETHKHPIPRKIIILPTYSLSLLIPTLFVAAVFQARHQVIPNVRIEVNNFFKL